MRFTGDPGHGGSDSGAFYFNTKESMLNLRMALLLKGFLHDGFGNNVVNLTRYHDVDLPPAERKRLIQVPADLFWCVHFNAVNNDPKAHGFESFIPRNARQEDIDLQAKVHEALYPVLGKWDMRDRGAKRMDFRVLLQKPCPGVFLEIGFMSNPDEYRKLIDRQFQTDFAVALADLFRSL